MRAGVTENPVRLTHSVQRRADPRHLRRRAGLRLARRRHHVHGGRQPHAGACVRLCAHASAGCAHRIHSEAQGLRGSRRLHGSRSSAGLASCMEKDAAIFPRTRTIRGRCRQRKSPRSGSVRERAQIRLLPDGRRLHLHDGPIDLIVEAFGVAAEINAAYRAAAERFVNVLDELCSELSFLRQPARRGRPPPDGVVARRMVAAVAALLRTDFHHAHGCRGGRSRGGNPGRHDFRSAIFRGLTSTTAATSRCISRRESILSSAWSSGRIVHHFSAPPIWTRRSRCEALQPAVGAAAVSRSASPMRSRFWPTARRWRTPPRPSLPMLWTCRVIPSVIRVPARSLAPDSDLGDRLVTQAVGELSSARSPPHSMPGLLSPSRFLPTG